MKLKELACAIGFHF